MSKRADAPYREGRGGDWRKAKCRLSQEVVIGGWTLPSDGRASIGALHVGFYEDGQLVYAGKVGSGFSERLLADLLQRLEARRRDTSPVRLRPRRDASAARTGSSRTSWPRSSSRSGRTRAGCASRCSSACATTATRATSCASGRARSRAAASTRWRRAGRGRRCASHATRTRAASGEEVVDLLGVRLTHPDRVYYPDLGFTKLDLALYYVSIADAVLPHLEGRPLTLVRCPDGLGGETFYQKQAGFWTPPQVRRFAVPGKAEEHLFVDSVPGLVALAQAGILEIHPWNSRVARLEQPDQVIFDLDPDEALPFSRVSRGGPARAGPAERARPRELREDDGRQGPARVRAARCRSAAGRSSRSSRGRWRSGSRATSPRPSPRTWPRRSARGRSTSTTCATSAAPTRWASTPRAPARARPSPSPWTGTSSTGSRAPPTSRSRRCRCACWASDRAAPPTRGRGTSSVKQRVPASLTRDLAE